DGQASVFGLIQRHEVIAKHQIYRDLLEQIVVQLEVMQVNELAAIAPGDILGLGQIVHVRRGSQTGPAISTVRDYRFSFRYFCHTNSSFFVWSRATRPRPLTLTQNLAARRPRPHLSEYLPPRRRSAGKAKSILRPRRPP